MGRKVSGSPATVSASKVSKSYFNRMSHSQLSFSADVASLVLVESELCNRQNSRALHIASSVDGSQSSDRACALSGRVAELESRSADVERLTSLASMTHAARMVNSIHRHSILHIVDPVYIASAPKHLQPRHLENYYDGISKSFRVPETQWVREQVI